MPVVKPRSSSSLELMKSEGNDSSDTIIRQAIKEPLLSFSRPGDSPVQLIQLLHALDQQELPGWPLLTPLKVQMQKCDKCSLEFCSPINYRRHIRVHHRLKKLDKDSTKNRDLLGAFWDKLSLEEAKEVVSFKNVTLEGVPGSSIVRSLTTLTRKPAFSTMSQVYLRAGSALLDIIQAQSRFPISAQELFGILDVASENTFLCGTAGLMQKYIFDGEAGKIGLETKNLVACTSFLVEQKLVKAWLADQDAEALRCQKLLVEEEEAAQKRKAELLERKRQKKLRQKEQKAKEQKHGEKVDVVEFIDNASEAMPVPQEETCSPSAACDSDTSVPEMLPDQAPSSSEAFRHTNSDEEASPDSQSGYGFEYAEPGISQNVERRMVHGSVRRHATVARWQVPPKSQRAVPNGFHSGQNSQASKLGVVQKHGIHRDLRAAPVANGNKVWSRKPKPEIDGEVLKARVQKEAINQPDQIKNREVLIGSICVTLRNCDPEINNLAGAREDCLAEHQMPKTDVQEKPIKPDSLLSGTNRSMIKLWRPVSRNENKGPMLVQNGNIESELDVTAEKDNDQNPNEGCLRSYAMDDNDGAAKESVCPGTMGFSIHGAKAFLSERWKEAITADHVKLVLSLDSEPPGCPEMENDSELVASQSLNLHKRSILGSAENRLVNAGAFDSSITRSVKEKYRAKPEKGVKKKYIPKQSNAT
ncbi:hypothetical protein SO802_024228 [Lithocarpus litseifolius]|uniref:C2H2-type domain-containing protein n=1 Tax=Lithocarpus litseifolius TaxID=425828 RepID=A0AAW2CBY3_9ROSI